MFLIDKKKYDNFHKYIFNWVVFAGFAAVLVKKIGLIANLA